MSKSVVSRVTQCLSDDFEVFRKRDLSSEELLYLELDGTFLRYHQGAEKKEPILVATGYRIDGTRVLLHIGVGNGESYANWKGFLQEMVARGLREPLLIVTDGNPEVLKAIEEVFPQSLKQRCQKSARRRKSISSLRFIVIPDFLCVLGVSGRFERFPFVSKRLCDSCEVLYHFSGRPC